MKNISLFLLFLVSLQSFSQSKNYIDVPYLETRAQADTLVTPDRIYITIILNEANTKGRQSTEELEQKMEQELTKLGIDTRNDLTLLDYSSNFRKYFLKVQDILKSKIYSLIVHDAITANKVLEALESAEISNVNIDHVEYSGEEQLLLALKSKAVAKAKEQAMFYTKPLGQSVGRALYISDTDEKAVNPYLSQGAPGSGYNIRIRGASSSVYGNSVPEPINVDFDKIEYRAAVFVVFKLE
ncbi:SIMPL domain-containing protein [Flavobacterium rhizosphaerae]|uniref:SIMPL domain-containing protein n=1 Tax=Flavobacterium rhizosphaerae TaxID=3163298 RepID=A0ABW8YYS3_9FLAO